MSTQRRYSAASPLAEPSELLSTMLSDLRVAIPAAWKLFVAGLRARYRQSLFGWIWLVVPTIASTLIWVYLAHRRILVTGSTAAPYAAYVTAGTLIFLLFVEALMGPLQRLVAARGAMAQTRLPHESWIVAGILDALFALLVRTLLLAVVVAWSGSRVGLSILLAPIGIAATVLLGLAVSVLLAPLALLRRDILEVLALSSTALFFLTPVIYRVPHIVLVRLDPLTPVLVTARGWIVGGPVEAAGFIAVVAGSLIVLVLGWVLYRVAQPHVVAQL